jgi:hypothetical protein
MSFTEEEEFEFALKYEQEQSKETRQPIDFKPVEGIAGPEPTMSQSVGEWLMPGMTKTLESGGKAESTLGQMGQVGMGALEGYDVLKRGLAHITGQGDIKDPEANVWAKPRETFRQLMDAKAKEAEGQMVQPPAPGAVPLSAMAPAETIPNLTKAFADQVFEVVGDPILAQGLIKQIFKTPVKSIAKGFVEAPRKVTGAVARELTKIPEETLTKYATKEGRRELAKSYAREAPTADALVRKVYTQKLPEEDLVDAFIQQADDIPLQPIIDKLEKAKESIKFKKTNRSSINAINKLIDDYKGVGETASASEFRELRKELDYILGDVYEKEGLSLAQKAFKGIRKDMKEALINASPKEYKNVMAEYARKMNSRSDIKELLGKDMGRKAKERAEGLLTAVEGKRGTFKKQALEQFDDLYGTNFTKRAETMHQARQIAAEPAPPGGGFTASTFPKIATGWGKLGVAVVGVGWPKTSGKILNALSGIENIVKVGGYKLPKKIADMTTDAQKVQALALIMKPMSQEKIDKINKLLGQREKTKDKKFKDLIDRNLNKILGEDLIDRNLNKILGGK